MLLRLGVAVLLSHAEINHVDDVSALRARAANEEVVGLDVTVDQILLVDGLDARQLFEKSVGGGKGCLGTHHLLCDHDDGLDGELSVAVVEQILQAGSEQVYD